MLWLMLRNTKVHELESDSSLRRDLLPGGVLPQSQLIKEWLRKRYSSRSNSFALNMRRDAFGISNEHRMNVATHSLSLSDSYWVTEDDSLKFDEISPYFSYFWDGDGPYHGGPAPTLYTDGNRDKKWLDRKRLYKKGCQMELAPAALCHALKIPCVSIKPFAMGITVDNFTSPEIMFEPASVSGRFPAWRKQEDVIREFGIAGARMLLIDYVICNVDRHDGNFGFMRSTGTGEYLGMSPLFDFDFADGDPESMEAHELLKSARYAADKLPTVAVELLQAVQIVDTKDEYKSRALVLLEQLN